MLLNSSWYSSPLRTLHQPLKLLAVLAIGLALAGCGGGGGGDSNGEQPVGGYTQASNVPFAISETTLEAAIFVPTIYAEAVQALALDAMDWLDRFASAPAPSLTWTCASTGTLTARWTDTDRNGQLGLGDELTLDLSGCSAPASASRLTGTLRLTIVAPSEPRAVAARVNLAGGISFNEADTRGTWMGSFTAERVSLERGNEMLVQAGAADRFRLQLQVGGTQAVERFEAIDFWRAVSPDFQSVLTSYGMTLASDALRGKLTLSTPTVIYSDFDTFPRRGTIEVVGGGRAWVTASSGGNAIFLRAVGSDGHELQANKYWTEFVQGLIWAGPGVLPEQYGKVREVSAVPFDYLGAASVAVEPSARTAVWQMNRALRLDLPIKAAKLVRSGDGWGSPTVEATVEVTGGRLQMRWTEQLEPGARYVVQWLGSEGQRFDIEGFLRSGTSGVEYTAAPTSAELVVAETVSAAIAPIPATLLLPGAVLRLDGSASRAAGGTPASYRWTQTAGYPLNPFVVDQPVLDVSVAEEVGMAPSDIEMMLEVTDVQGVTDRQVVRFQAVPSPSTSVLATLRGSAGDSLLNGVVSSGARASATAARLFSGGSSLAVSAFVNFGAAVDAPSISFYLPTSVPLQTGTYSAPFSASQRGEGAGLLISSSPRWCDGPGTFTILEAELGEPDGSANGTPLLRFAADFSLSCSPGTPPVSGAIRVRSALPLPS